MSPLWRASLSTHPEHPLPCCLGPGPLTVQVKTAPTHSGLSLTYLGSLSAYTRLEGMEQIPDHAECLLLSLHPVQQNGKKNKTKHTHHQPKLNTPIPIASLKINQVFMFKRKQILKPTVALTRMTLMPKQ